MAMRVRRETVAELTGATRAMRSRMSRVAAPAGAIDVCGTGGDGSGSLNVSTAVTFVLAGLGVTVAKHGNRNLSSKSGAADALTEMGLNVMVGPQVVEQCLAEAGIGFMMAPMHHPAMRHVGPVRAELGTRTIFNILGPLTNPAGVKRQLTGAFAGAALVFLNYREAFQRFDPGLEKSAGVFATFPAFPAAPMAGFVDQVIGTALLLFLVLAVTDHENAPPPPGLTPLFIGLIVVAIGMGFGPMHGYAINPARDLGPRLFTALAGFRNNGLTDGTGIFWVPLIAPFLGGIIGAGVYDFGFRRFLR